MSVKGVQVEVVNDTFPLGTGGATAAKQDSEAVLSGAVTETAPTTDTASSGLNGRLQRIAQRLTSLIALVPASLGRKSFALSLGVVQAGMPYETVAASQTDQVLGGAGAAGDYLDSVVIQPAALTAGTVVLKDGASTIFTFTAGTLASLAPIPVHLGIVSTGALSVTTGLSVAVLAVGNFT